MNRFIIVALFGLFWTGSLSSVASVDGLSIAPVFAEEVIEVAQAPSAENPDESAEPGEGAKAKEKVTGFTDQIFDTWDRVYGWFKSRVKWLTDKVEAVFGFEQGEGPLAMFGGVFYLFIIIVILLCVMFVFNIIRDFFAGVAARKKHARPAFRKRR